MTRTTIGILALVLLAGVVLLVSVLALWAILRFALSEHLRIFSGILASYDAFERRFEGLPCRRVGAVTGCDHPVCVAIYYPDGRAGVDYHSDPPAFGDTRAIASISLGCERRFGIRDLEGQAEDYVMRLAHGSLLTMGPGFQDRYAHAILLEETCTEPRINLTFRCFG